MAFVDITSFNKETQTKSVICDLPISFHFLKTLHLDGWIFSSQRRSRGTYAYPRRWRPDLVKGFGAGPVSKLLFVPFSLNVHGWRIWTYL